MNSSIKPSTFPHRFRPVGIAGQSGLSMVEIMIAITVGLLLLAGMATLFAQQSSSSDELEKAGRQIENGRYAMQILQDDIRHAGYYGEYSPTSATIPASLPDPCATTPASLDPAMALPIQGYDAPTTVPSPLSVCLSDANHKTGTDILVIRRADTEDEDVASAAAGQVYLQTTPTAYVLGSGSNTSVFTLKQKNGVTLAELHQYYVRIYFISPCSVPAGGGTSCTGSSDDNGRPIPTLKRLDLTVVGGAAAFSITPLVEGIDQLQLDYGLDTTGDGTPDSYTTAPASTTDWTNVMAVRVNLLARNNDPSGGYSDGKTYSLGSAGSFGPFNDAYKRHAYNALVRATNPSGRREQ